jgi:4-hydroxy-3-polyprenylbenzoate decarboxylase
MAYRDLREFLDALEKNGELIRIKDEVDWDLEVGAIIRLACQLDAPAPLMENIRDYPGQSMMGGYFSSYRKAAIAIGIDPDSDPATVLDAYHQRIKHPIKPIIVNRGVCQENVVTGDDVNLFDIASPMPHDGDAGRYIATWQFVATPDYDTDWINWGMYRQMIQNEKVLGGLVMPMQDIGYQFYTKYLPNKKPMPWATVIGTEPITTIVSAAPYGIGRSEVDWAGGLRLEPVELVKCVSQPLYVPANAEYIIEGYVNPTLEDRAYEGPWGEYTGYRTSPRAPRTAFHVTAITYRNNPIHPHSPLGVPVDDSHMAFAILVRSDMLNVLENNAIPVVALHVPPEMVGHVVVVSIKKPQPNLANLIASLLFGTKNTGFAIRDVIVCDEDVDVYDLDQVLHVLATKWHPRRGTTFYDNQVGMPLTPYLSMEERLWGRTAKMVYDCTWPLDWSPTRDIPVRSSFWDIYPERIIEEVCHKWQRLGFKEDMNKIWEHGKKLVSWK